MAKKRLPEKLFIRWHNGDPDDSYLQADTCAEMLILPEDIGEETEAGIYELKKTVKLVNKTTVI